LFDVKLTPLLMFHCSRHSGEIAVAMENPYLQTVVDQDGAAILDIDRGRVSTLNPTGAFVWQRLWRGETIEAIIADLACETGEEISVIESDVREFVELLKERRLLQS
jgi:hypothetical protein